MKIKPLGHNDLLKRIQNSVIEAGMPGDMSAGIGEPHGQRDPWDGFGEGPNEQFRKWEGSKRWEFTVPAKSLIRFVHKIFGGKKS